MVVQVIASGSKGNCTVLNSAVMLDAGISFKRLQQALNYQLPEYALITHEHGDHANKATIKELLLRGVEVYMTVGTCDALGLESAYNLHAIKPHLNTMIQAGGYVIGMFDVVHDAAEPAGFVVVHGDESILYVTDLAEVPIFGDFTKIIIETNYSVERLIMSRIDGHQRDRILANHLAIEKVADYFKTFKSRNFLGALQEIHLIHLSTRHGDGEEFKKILEQITGDIPIYTH